MHSLLADVISALKAAFELTAKSGASDCLQDDLKLELVV